MFATILVILGIFSRVMVHTPQFTALLAISMFAGLYLSRRTALIVPLAVMMITDLILGFHDTMVYTWGSILLISMMGVWLRNHKSLLNVFAGSLVSALVFFVITNFGAWLSLYPRTWAGFAECYTMAIPFFRSTVLYTMSDRLVLYVAYEWMLKRSEGTRLAPLFIKK